MLIVQPDETANQINQLTETSNRVLVLRTLYFFYLAGFGIITTYLNVYYRDIGLSGVKIGLLSSFLPLVSIIVAPMWGTWSDRIGQARKLLMLASSGIIVAISGLSLSNSFIFLVIFTLMFAFFDSSVLPMLDSATLRTLGENRAQFGRHRVVGSVGYILTAFGIGLVLKQYGTHWLFLFFILAILGVFITSIWLPSQKVDVKLAVYNRIVQLVARKEWLLFSASLVLFGIGNFAVYGFLGIYIKDLGGDEGLVGASAALATITELPILFWGDKLLKNFGPWRLMMLAYAAMVLRLFLYSRMTVPGWAIAISLLHCMTFGLYWISVVASIDQMASDEIKSSAMGLMYAVLNISRMLASLFIGYLYDQVGGGNLFFISSGISFLALILLWVNKPMRNQTNYIKMEVKYEGNPSK